MRNEFNQIGNTEIRDELRPYDFSPSDEQCGKIRRYIELLLQWNRSISLTSITAPREMVGRHFGESIFLSKFAPVQKCRLVDIGTGAGFPGLALKIAEPSIRVLLIESNRKKCVFLSEVVRALGLSDVEINVQRFEMIRPEEVKASVITSRAVGGFKELLHWSALALARRGHVALWLGAEDSTRVSTYPGWIWQPPAKLPESQRRFIVIGRSARATMQNPWRDPQPG